MIGVANNFYELLQRWVGTTVTIFTTSGGESGCGFTGVLMMLDPCFVRLITSIGPAPGCVLGNACNQNSLGGNRGGRSCGCGSNSIVTTVGSVCDIPIDRIAAFVHNAV